MPKRKNTEIQAKLTCNDFRGVSLLWVIDIEGKIHQGFLILKAFEDIKVEMWGHLQPQSGHTVNSV